MRSLKVAFAAALLVLSIMLVTSPPASATMRGGRLDSKFGKKGKVLTDLNGGSEDLGYGVAVQSDGKIVEAGFSLESTCPCRDFALARYTPRGALDPTFGTGGIVRTDFGTNSADEAFAVAIQSDGKLVAAGLSDSNGSFDFALARYNSDGTLDTTFGTGGKVLTDLGSTSSDIAVAVALQANGKIVAAGQYNANTISSDFAVVRYNSDGTLDGTFGTGGKLLTDLGSQDVANAMALQSDGKIVVGGTSTAGTSSSFDFALVRYNSDGTLDGTFGTGGAVLTDFSGSGSFDQAFAVAIQSDGKILAAGGSGAEDFALARYTSSGTLDTSFGTGGTTTSSVGADGSVAYALEIQTDGKIIAAGTASNDFALARYGVSGLLDSSFGTGGVVLTSFGAFDDEARALAIQSNGRIVAAGDSSQTTGYDFALARYRP